MASDAARDSDRTGVAERLAAFAREHVCPREDLLRPGSFPSDLWHAMAVEGFLSLGVPEAFGGLGVGLDTQIAAAESLVRGGHNLGLAVAWQGHNTLARFLLAGLADTDQKARYLPAVAAGNLTVAVAISEPGAGAHPKYLRTKATRDHDGWILNGEKAWVTNGPIAGLFAVLAITAEEGGRKRYSAFLVPRDTPGLGLSDAGRVDALYPAQHCGLRLENCSVPAEALLGEPHTAYERIARPIRDLEDLLQVGTLAGGMLALLDMASEAVQRTGGRPTDAAREAAGGLFAIVTAIRALGRMAVRNDAERGTLLLAVRQMAGNFLSGYDGLIQALGVETTPGIDAVRRDLGIIAGVARQVVGLRLQRLGDSVLGRLD